MTKKSDLQIELKVFLQSTMIRNTWIEDERIKVYLRKSKRYYGDVLVDCIDLATFKVAPKYRR